PHLSSFNLYRVRNHGATVGAGAATIELASVDGASDSLSLAAFALKKGDRLLLLPAEPSWPPSGTVIGTQQHPQVVVVSRPATAAGRTVIELEGGALAPWPGPNAAYRLGRTFRHFGHNAPPKTTTSKTDPSGPIPGSKEADTKFDRHVYPH